MCKHPGDMSSSSSTANKIILDSGIGRARRVRTTFPLQNIVETLVWQIRRVDDFTPGRTAEMCVGPPGGAASGGGPSFRRPGRVLIGDLFNAPPARLVLTFLWTIESTVVAAFVGWGSRVCGKSVFR